MSGAAFLTNNRGNKDRAGGALQTHIWRMRILEVRLRAAIDLGNAWELALETARELLIFYHWLYPKVF